MRDEIVDAQAFEYRERLVVREGSQPARRRNPLPRATCQA
jgi:hypothetical protein